MNIVIMRHGQAETYAPSDAQRNLTELGHQQARAAGQCLQQLSLSFDQVWVSPYNRAQQTADEVLLSLAESPRFTAAGLTPESPVATVIDKLEQSDSKNVLIVSHQPLVSVLVALLNTADSRSGPPMAPASMAMLSTEKFLVNGQSMQGPLAGCCELQWLRHAPSYEKEF